MPLQEHLFDEKSGAPRTLDLTLPGVDEALVSAHVVASGELHAAEVAAVARAVSLVSLEVAGVVTREYALPTGQAGLPQPTGGLPCRNIDKLSMLFSFKNASAWYIFLAILSFSETIKPSTTTMGFEAASIRREN